MHKNIYIHTLFLSNRAMLGQLNSEKIDEFNGEINKRKTWKGRRGMWAKILKT